MHTPLFTWAQEQGLACPKLRYPVRFDPGYLGSQATEEIGPNEAIVTVPRHLLFMAGLADSSEFGAAIAEHPELFNPDSHSWADDFRLIALLLFERHKREASFWHPFLQSLPDNVDMLTKWTQEELAMLQDELLLEDVQYRREEAVDCWQQFSEALQQYPQFFTADMLSFEQFSWAYDIVATRAFGMSLRCNTLCPVAEFLNHAVVPTYYLYSRPGELHPRGINEDDGDALPCDSKRVWPVSYSVLAEICAVVQQLRNPEVLVREAERLDSERYALLQAACWQHVEKEDTSDFVFRILTGPEETYSAGSEICLCYGAESNRHLLLHYGFSLAANRYNYEYIFVPASEFLPPPYVACVKAAELSDVWCFKVREREVCQQLLRTLRAMRWNHRCHALEACFLPRDWALEASVIQTARDIASDALGQYPTTIAEDEELMRQPHDIRAEFALRYRRQRKLALQTQVQLLDALAGVVQSLQEGKTLADATAHLHQRRYEPLNLNFHTMLSPYLTEVQI